MAPQRWFVFLVRFLVGLGALAAASAGALRYRAEHRNRSVAIAVDYSEVERLASGSGTTVRHVLARLRRAGATAAAVTEDTLEDLADCGLASISGTERLATVRLTDQDLLQRVADAWRMRGVVTVTEPDPAGGPYTLLWCPQLPGQSVVFRGAVAALRTLGSGFRERALADVRAAGLEPVGRVSNFPGLSEERLERVLRDAASKGIRVVVCPGTEVFGYYGQSQEAATALKRSGVLFGQVEFGKQKGDAALGMALKGRFVRVHSISEGEMGTLSESEAVDRFVRAARERNIRLCYVRLLTQVGADALESNGRYLAAIARGIQRGGLLQTGPAKSFADPGVPAVLRLTAGVGLGALLTWLLALTWPGAGRLAWLILAGFVVGCVGLGAAGNTGAKLAALIAAVAAPSLASLRVVQVMEGCDRDTQYKSGEALRLAVVELGRMSGITAVGILFVVGMLSSLPYMVRAEQFMGIKLAHAVPMAVVAAALVAGLPRWGDSASEAWARMRRRTREFLSQPMLVGWLLLTGVLAVAMLLALLRTGNEPGVGISGLELKFRALLDAILPARPRTKEFLIGHPAMVVAVFLVRRNLRVWAAPLAVLGALGQASLLNTFCHIHTPLMLSVVRAGTGLVLGAVVGCAVCLLVARCCPGTIRKLQAEH